MSNQDSQTIGQRTPLVDGRSKVTGEATYTDDIKLHGMLYVVGGTDDTGAPVTSVFHSAVELDRTNAVWTVESALPVPLHSMGVAVFRSWLTVVR